MKYLSLCAALALACAAGPLRAQTNALRVEMDLMAKEVAANLKDLPNPVESVVVGDFTGPATQSTSGGSVISMVLSESLKKHGIRVAQRAEVGIKGEYEDVKDAESGELAIRISATCTNRNGKKLFECQKRGAFGEALVTSVLGVSANIPPDASTKQRNEIIEKAIESPSCHIAGPTVCSTPQSQYAVEIHVAPRSGAPYAPRPARVEDGLAFVPLRRGEVFAVKLINRSPYDAAAALTLDGLNAYAFCEERDHRGQPKHSQFIVSAGKAGLIRGWFINLNQSDEFTVTAYSKSAAFALKSNKKTGTIQVAYSAAWPKSGPKPPDEPANPSEHSRGGKDAIGRGQRIDDRYKLVDVDVGVIRETISVRYTK